MLTSVTILLLNNFLHCFAFFLQIQEDILDNFSLLGCWSSSEQIGITIKPFVNSFVNFEIFITNFLTGDLFLECFGLSGGSVFVCATDVDGVVAPESCKSSINVSREDTSNNVSEMWYIVYVRKSRSDQDISLSLNRQDLFTFVKSNKFGIRIGNFDVFSFFLGFSNWGFAFVLNKLLKWLKFKIWLDVLYEFWNFFACEIFDWFNISKDYGLKDSKFFGI